MTPEQIRETRARLHMTQAQLAHALSADTSQQPLDPQTVSRWERGERKPAPYLPLALASLKPLQRASKQTKRTKQNRRVSTKTPNRKGTDNYGYDSDSY